MSEVQAHGNIFEDAVIRSYTGLSKTEYQKLLENSYVSSLDLKKGVIVNFNGSVKVTGGNGIAAADILKFYQNTKEDLTMIVGSWKQVTSEYKVVHSVYEFNIKTEHFSLLWKNITEDALKSFVNYVKSIPAGKEQQLANRSIWKQKRDKLFETHGRGLIKIDAKIDSGTQRRVQCSLKLEDLLNVIPHTKYTDEYNTIVLPYKIASGRRKFNKA